MRWRTGANNGFLSQLIDQAYDLAVRHYERSGKTTTVVAVLRPLLAFLTRHLQAANTKSANPTHPSNAAVPSTQNAQTPTANSNMISPSVSLGDAGQVLAADVGWSRELVDIIDWDWADFDQADFVTTQMSM
jgi:hypothetical protein